MAKSVSDRIELAGESLEKAASTMIHQKLPALGGDGGLIAVDRKGNVAMPFNTAGMFRAVMKKGMPTPTILIGPAPPSTQKR
jgi:beta-aspartyl-peptidase (threonine type)